MTLLNKMCRLCLKNAELVQYISIYKKDPVDSVEIITKIKYIMPSLELLEKGTAQCVCPNCLLLLREFFNFKTVCEKSAFAFMEIVKQARSDKQNSQSPAKTLKIVPLQKLRGLEAPSSSLPSLVPVESITTPKIIAVYSLQCNNPNENSVTGFCEETIKIEDDPDVEFISEAVSNTLKRTSTETDSAPSQPKIIKLTENQTNQDHMTKTTNNSVTNDSIDNNEPDDFDVLIPLEPIVMTKPPIQPETPLEPIVMTKPPIQPETPPPTSNVENLTETECDFPNIFKNEIWKAVDSQLSVTSRKLQRIIGEKYRIWPCTIQIERVIKPLHYNLAREPEATQVRNGQAVIAARLQYAKEYTKFNEDDFIFVHEMGIRLAIRKKISFNYVYDREFRVQAAMSRKELIYFRVVERPYNIEEYGNWITHLLPILKWKKKENSILITENCPSYKIESRICSEGHRILFLPPYSPFLNPLENIFSKWQRDIKTLECLVLETLIANMKEFNLVINQTDCEIVYDKMKNCLSRCIKRISF